MKKPVDRLPSLLIFALIRGRPASCPIGGIGRRARLKIEFRKECWFDPGMGHHYTTQLFALLFYLSGSIETYPKIDGRVFVQSAGGGVFLPMKSQQRIAFLKAAVACYASLDVMVMRATADNRACHIAAETEK